MTNTYEYAKRELELLLEFSTSKDRPMVEPYIPEILALCEKFGRSGHSGGSAPLVASVVATAIHDLLLQRPLQPLTGEENEWIEATDPAYPDGMEIYQNVRNGGVFKEGKDGQPYFIDAIIWRDKKGDHTTGSAYMLDGRKYTSHQYFTMPFHPVSFYVDVQSLEDGDNGEEVSGVIRHREQLEQVFRYYINPYPEEP